MIMCVLLCYPVSIRTYYQQGVLFLVPYCSGSAKAVLLNFKKFNVCFAVLFSDWTK